MTIATVTNWLYFFNAAMIFYGVWALYSPDSLIVSFSGNKSAHLTESADKSGIIITQLSKRLGIVYIFFAIVSIYFVYVANRLDSLNCWSILFMLCLLSAVYSAALCMLIASGQEFWASDGVIKNIPFVAINLFAAYKTWSS